MGVTEDFELAAAAAKELPEKISNEDKLALYGLFKQGTVGDVNTDRPGMFDQKGRAKWDAWKSHAGKSKELAMTEYIKLVEDLKAKYA
eukprot:jgi/Ulvmu1/4964/UM207_0008.1